MKQWGKAKEVAVTVEKIMIDGISNLYPEIKFDVDIEVADVSARSVVETGGRTGELGEDRPHFQLVLCQLNHQVLLGTHLIGERR